MGSGMGGFVRLPGGGIAPRQRYEDEMAANEAMSSFDASATAPIPGMFNGRPIQQPDPNSIPPELRDTARRLTGGVLSQYMNNDYTPSDWRGLLPPSATPLQGPGPSQFQPSGPYGQQAMMMAGLLGQSPQQSPQQPGSQGLLANPKRGPRMMYGK